MLGKHLLGEEATTLLKSIFNSMANQETVKNDLNMGKLGLDVVEQHQRHKTFKKDFITQVKELIKFVSEGKEKQQKVFIFIDELDRCRPTYAIEMLETVKHLFNIPNFIFVLSTDTNQLQHSIKAVYGNEFDSHEYLSRFFEQRLTLPEPDFLQFMTAHDVFRSVRIETLNSFPSIQNTEELREAVNVICRLNKTSLSLRRLKQICSQLEVVLTSKDFKEVIFPIFDLIGIVFGDALYGGLSEPNKPIIRAILAYREIAETSEIQDFQLNKYKATEIISKLSMALSTVPTNQQIYNFNAATFNADEIKNFNFSNDSLNDELNTLSQKISAYGICIEPQKILDAINSLRVDIEL